MNEPVLATKTYTRDGTVYRIRVEGGLHKIGGQAPYFSITASVDRRARNNRWIEDMGGCCHEEIERVFPGRFSDLIALHLSTEDGTPMHATENGYYWLAGSCAGGLGETFHGGNAKLNLGKEYRNPSSDECLLTLAKHLRLSFDEARSMRDKVAAVSTQDGDAKTLRAERKAVFSSLLNPLRARWASEAAACIAKHGLVVFNS